MARPGLALQRIDLALDSTTVTALKQHRARQAEERLAAGSAWDDHGLVFAREDGTPIHPERFSRWFQRQLRAAGLPRIRLHDLRHSHATLDLRAGVHPKVVSERSGHANIAITLDTYSHAIPPMQREAAEMVSGLVFGTGG